LRKRSGSNKLKQKKKPTYMKIRKKQEREKGVMNLYGRKERKGRTLNGVTL
jgi:hypothetical protein